MQNEQLLHLQSRQRLNAADRIVAKAGKPTIRRVHLMQQFVSPSHNMRLMKEQL